MQKQLISVRNRLDWFRFDIEELSVSKIAYYPFTTTDIM